MKQHKLESLIEALINTLTGMVIAYCTFQFILAPLLGIPIGYGQNLIITLSLTVVSVVRSYFWRRVFATGLHKRVHCYLTKNCKPDDYIQTEFFVTDEEMERFLETMAHNEKRFGELKDEKAPWDE